MFRNGQDDTGALKYITFFDRDIGKIKEIIKGSDGNLLYVKDKPHAMLENKSIGKTLDTNSMSKEVMSDIIPQTKKRELCHSGRAR